VDAFHVMIGATRRNDVREIELGIDLKAPAFKLKQRKNSKIHSLSNSSTSKWEHNSRRVLRYATESRSFTSSTRANSSSSCILDCWYEDDDDDIKDAMTTPLADEILALYQFSTDIEELRGSKNESGVEVIAYGTKLMAIILFPTIIIKTENMKLYDSTLYYLILEASSGAYNEEIACVMFSSPHNGEKTLQTAELLPLRGERPGCVDDVPLIPMLLDQSYRPIFEIGSTFTVKAIEKGRRSNLKGRKWKDYDMASPEIHLLLRRLLYLDINQIPIRLFNSFKSSIILELPLRSCITMERESYPQQKVKVESANYEPNNSSTNVIHQRRSKRHRSYAQFLNSVPIDNRINKDGENDHAIKLSKDKSDNLVELDECVFLSLTI
jgi:hypothetical protein